MNALWAERVTAKVALGWRHLAIRPGDRVTLPGRPGTWRVAATALSGQVVELDLTRVAIGTLTASADPGRHTPEPDAPHGSTTLALVDLPPLSDSPATTPQVAVAAAGVSPGWRRAALLTSLDAGVTWQEAGQTAAPAIIGAAATVLAPGTTAMLDLVNSVDVDLLNPAMTLGDADMTALLRGENLAMLGDELIQFGQAAPLGGNRWRLSRLLRGRRGSEWAVAGHAAGDSFVMIEADALAMIGDVTPGAVLSILASGIGDPTPATASAVIDGRAVLPLSPVHASATLLPDGDTRVAWTRRSRMGWRWPDLIEAPLGEETELYRLVLSPASAIARTIETPSPTYIYTAADRAADIAAGAVNLRMLIRQVGAFGVSRPLTISIPLI